MESEVLRQKLMDYALRLVARRSYTVHQIQERLDKRFTKLKGTEDQIELINKVIDRLTELKFLNDMKFCEHWIEERSRLRPRGRFLLTRELRQKGIPNEILDQFWENGAGAEFDEQPFAIELAEKRFKRFKPNELKGKNTWASKQKVYRFLASRGFSVDVIREALDKANKPY